MRRDATHPAGPGRPFIAFLIVGLILPLLGACGGYAQRMGEVRMAVERNDLETARSSADTLVERAEAGRSPERYDLPLLLLERGAILQAMGDHAAAVRDFTDADQMMELLDLTPDGIQSAAEYLWSGDVTLYRPPVYEKLMVNVSAMASFLHMGQTSSARVEARRARVLIEYFQETDLAGHPMIGAANYMSGLAMEMAGERSSALRFYMDAWQIGRAPGLAESIVRLAEGTQQATSVEVREAREALGLAEGERLGELGSEVIVIVLGGLAPRREPEYLPVGVVYAYLATSQQPMSQEQQQRYNRIMAEGLLTWVNYPVLNRFANQLTQFDVQVGGQRQSVEQVADIESFVLAEWERVRGQIAFAAITRAITRIIAREATQAGVEALSGNRTVGFLAGLAVQGGMQAADRPDTRNWTMLPAGLYVSRIPLPPGEQQVRVRAMGGGIMREHTVNVTVPERGARIVALRFLN